MQARAHTGSGSEHTGRTSRGVISMRVQGNEVVIKAFAIESGQNILTVSSRGIGKRTEENEFTSHHKGE